MDTRDFLQLALLACDGEIKGKTMLQKMLYFLGLLTDCAGNLGYRAHFYGPYSDEVNHALTYLKTIDVLDESVTPWGAVDQSGFEVRRYDFRLNAQGRKLAELKARQNPEMWTKITAAREKLSQAGKMDYVSLSIAAKTYFMLGEKRGPATESDLVALAPRFGWSVTPAQIRDAATYLSRLGLVELRQVDSQSGSPRSRLQVRSSVRLPESASLGRQFGSTDVPPGRLQKRLLCPPVLQCHTEVTTRR